MPADYSSHGPGEQHDGVPLDVILQEQQEPSSFTKDKPPGSFDSTASADSSLTAESDNASSHKPSSQKSAQELLDKAHSRLKLSEYEQKIVDLKEELMDKSKKISTLTLQLRRATASKCDLVVACSDIEAQKIGLEELHGKEERKWKQMPLREQEVRAEVEKEFMNELTLLMDQMNDMKRRHKNELLEKDFEVAQLQEKLRRKEMGEDSNVVDNWAEYLDGDEEQWLSPRTIKTIQHELNIRMACILVVILVS